MKALGKIGTKIAKVTGRTGLVLKKKSPELLLAAGIVGFVGTVVLACKATLNADKILDHYEEKKKDILEAKKIAEENPDTYEYDVDLYERDHMILRLQTMGNFLKLYAPTIALGSLSVACLITSRNILNKRYLAAVSAYNALSEVFQQYRKRVVDEYGEKLDRHFRYGTTYHSETETEAVDGKKIKKKVDIEEMNNNNPSGVAVFFDEFCPNWDENPKYSLMFLRCQQNLANDKLHSRGHLFLNEVYDMLGFPQTSQGALLGWIDNGKGDGYVDFGLYDQHKEGVRRFVNGVENTVLLDFNHDGVIWDKI